MKYTPEEAINFTRKSVALLGSWPPSVNTSRKKLFLLDAYFYISFIITVSSLAVLINGMYTYRDNIEIIIQSICTGMAIAQMCFKMVVCKMKRSNLQLIVTEMECVVKEALPYERAILEKYIDKCAPLHIFFTASVYLAAIAYMMGPIFLPQSLPTFAIYPFRVDYHPVYEIVYLQQTFTGLQASAAATIDCQVASLLWFATARFEMLTFELKNVLNNFDLNRCILKHQHILRYAEDVTTNLRYVILTTVGVTAVIIVFSGLLFIYTDSMTIKYQFSVVATVSVGQLFLNSYPAENLLQMSYAVGTAAYNLNWIDKSREMWKNIFILIQRSQKPTVVRVGGFLPSLSLAYYMSFLSTSFSYFTTMRATVQ